MSPDRNPDKSRKTRSVGTERGDPPHPYRRYALLAMGIVLTISAVGQVYLSGNASGGAGCGGADSLPSAVNHASSTLKGEALSAPSSWGECTKGFHPKAEAYANIQPNSAHRKKTAFAALKGLFINGAFATSALKYDTKKAAFDAALNTTHEQLLARRLRLFGQHGINIIHRASPSKDVTSGIELLEKLRKAAIEEGIQVIYHANLLNKKASALEKDMVQTWLTEYAERYAQARGIFAWYIYDEPSIVTPIAERVKTIGDAFFTVDSRHPVTLATNDASAPYAAALDLYMGEDYDLMRPHVRGTEDVRHAETRIADAAAESKFAYANVLWANDDGRWLPTPAHIRRMAFISLANGVNGWIWYLGAGGAPPWIGLGGETYSRLRNSSLSDHFDIVSPALKAIGKLAEDVTPAASLLLGATHLKQHPFKVESCEFEVLGWKKTVKSLPQIMDPVTKPAVALGVWDTGRNFVIVVYNRDTASSRTARLHLPALGPDQKVYDLLRLPSFALPNAANGSASLSWPAEAASADAPHEFQLEPGDGRLFVVATKAEFASIKKQIYRAKYRQLYPRLVSRRKLIKAYGVGDISKVDAKFANSKTAMANGNTQLAYLELAAGRTLLEEAVAASKYGPLESEFKTIRETFFAISQWCKKRLPLLADRKNKTIPQLSNGPLWNLGSSFSNGPDGLGSIMTELRQLSATYYPLINGMESGNTPDLSTVQHLRTHLQSIEHDLRHWNRQHVDKNNDLGFRESNTNVGLIFMPGVDLYRNDLWHLAQFAFTNATPIRLKAPGQFVDADDNPVALEDFDALWLHLGASNGEAFLDAAQTVAVHPAVVAAETIAAFNGYLEQGKGLFLSGHATQLVVNLGLETVAPNVVDIDKQGFLSQLIRDQQFTVYQRLGIRARRAAEEHPIFDFDAAWSDWDQGRLWLRQESMMRVRNRSSWRAPDGPKNGYILGGYTSAMRPPPNNRDYDLVEFRQPSSSTDGTASPAKVIACGLPIFDFSFYVTNPAKPDNHDKTMIRFVQNIVDYLPKESVPFAFPEGYLGNLGPLLSTNLAAAGTATFTADPPGTGLDHIDDDDLNLNYHWTGSSETKTGTQITLEFSGPATINKVAIFNGWNAEPHYVTEMELRYKTAANEFVPVPETTSFEGNGLYGITFDFPPITTTAIRLAGIKGPSQLSPANNVYKPCTYGQEDACACPSEVPADECDPAFSNCSAAGECRVPGAARIQEVIVYGELTIP